MMQSKGIPFAIRFNAFAGKAGLLCAILLFPLVFQKVFAMGPLRTVEWNRLMTFSIFLMALSAACWYRKEKMPFVVTMALFVFLLLAGMELAVRLSLKLFADAGTLHTLSEECNWTYTDSSAYKGHPFIQFTGRPSVTLQGTQAHSGRTPYNNF